MLENKVLNTMERCLKDRNCKKKISEFYLKLRKLGKYSYGKKINCTGGLGSAKFMVGLDLKGLFQPE